MRTVITLPRLTLALAVAFAALALAPAAGASTSATMTLDQSAGHSAGSTVNLGLDLKFTNSGTDSPQHLTLNLPPGLLANASVDGGACLRTANVSGTACRVGTGTVTATADPVGLLNVPVPVSVPVSFYLVPPPSPGDLAGLAVEGLGEQIGSTAGIRVRPSGDPHGVGVTLALVLPDQLPLTLPLVGHVNAAQISLTEINSTFDGLRYPGTCPATPAALTATVDSYQDPALHTLTAPLAVTGCSGLPYSPAFRVSATRDSGDRQVSLTTTITQAASEAPSRSVSLAFPGATLAPNLASIQALCVNLASGTCHAVGSATAVSPLYPKALTGQAYLTGSASGLALTLVFPSPFPLTLTGSVDLVANSATFTGLPDIPLTSLAVTLVGGAHGLFLSTCQAPSGTATATLTDQNGDRTARVPGRFTVAGCPGASGGGGPAGGGLPSAVGGRGNGSTSRGVTVAGARFSRGRFTGLRSGHPALSFRISAPRLSALTIALPRGLRLLHRRTRAHVALGGGRVASLTIMRGRLVIDLRRAVAGVTVRIGRGLLAETAGLRRRAQARRLTRLPVAVAVRYAGGRHSTLHVQITDLR
ncbi:MAG TPA: hypothetical protein VFN87_13515 [Solirubrobacteraceae bacterium]|nr:hypothetical protein [Solirubrobacteraceae bacterium]